MEQIFTNFFDTHEKGDDGLLDSPPLVFAKENQTKKESKTMAVLIKKSTMEKIENRLNELFEKTWKGEQSYSFLKSRLMDEFSGISSYDLHLEAENGGTINFFGCDAFLHLLEHRGFQIRKVFKDGCLLRQYVQPK